MERERKGRQPHCLVLCFPAQGHINPMLQFSKRLVHKNVKVTFVTTRFICKTIQKDKNPIAIESISDGFDNGGMAEAESDKAYVESFWKIGQQTFTELVEKLFSSGNPVDCVVYDSFLIWALDVAKKFGVLGAAFFTQSCAVNTIFYHVKKGNLKLPLSEADISLPGLPKLAPSDMPSFLYQPESYPAFLEMVVNQFSNIDQANWVLCNAFYELEHEEADWQAKIWPMKTVGPTIPSMFLDKQLKDDKSYGFSLFKPNNEACMKWLSEKSSGSVVYVSFGSMAVLSSEQMEEIAYALMDSENYFIWVARASEQGKLPKDILENSNKGLVVTWCDQLEVLENVGCFVTHCGWNSILESVSLGVPMVGMPQWSDQPTNAKYVMDVWKIGVMAKADEKRENIVMREEIKQCIKEVMESERGKEMKRNAHKLKVLAAKALDEGGSSEKNIRDFVKSLVPSSKANDDVGRVSHGLETNGGNDNCIHGVIN